MEGMSGRCENERWLRHYQKLRQVHQQVGLSGTVHQVFVFTEFLATRTFSGCVGGGVSWCGAFQQSLREGICIRPSMSVHYNSASSCSGLLGHGLEKSTNRCWLAKSDPSEKSCNPQSSSETVNLALVHQKQLNQLRTSKETPTPWYQ
jgi:hypothetical protein